MGNEPVYKILVMDGPNKLDKAVFEKSEIRLLDKDLLRENWKTVQKLHILVVTERVKEFFEKGL